jgi:hypothetical protein
MEKRQEVRTVQVDYECTHCKVGVLSYSANVATTSTFKYYHRCNVCDSGGIFEKKYPYIDYIIKESKINEE